jgi:hypothetical protein
MMRFFIFEKRKLVFVHYRERVRERPKWCDHSRIVVEGGFKEFRFREKLREKKFFFHFLFLIRINLKAKNEIFFEKTLIKNKLVNKI